MADQPAIHVEEKQLARPAEKAPLGFHAATFEEAWRITQYLEKSSLVPDALRGKPYDILYVVVAGADFGLSPMQSVRDIVIIKGKPYFSALLRVAMVKNSPHCKYFRCVHSDATKATFETERIGEGVTPMTYTLEDAKQAGLVERGGNWATQVKLMLRRRCASQLADEVYPDVLRGSADREEIPERELNPSPLRAVGITTAPPPPVDAEVVPPPSPPKKERKLEVVDVPAKADQPADLSEYDKVCALLKECQTLDAVDTLSMNTGQVQFTATERQALGLLFKAKRKALEPKK